MNTRSLSGQRVAIYARYSSDNQRTASIDDQVRRCRAYIELLDGVVDPALMFLDYALSGSSMQRPAFEQMLAKVKAKPRGIDVIVTEDISRITRDFADGAVIYKTLKFHQVQMLGVADGIDTSAKGAKMNFVLKSLMADVYLDDLRDKTHRGLIGRALAGFSTGGLPLGYKSREELDAQQRTMGHVIEIDEKGSNLVRRVFDDYAAGHSFSTIACALNAEGVPPPRVHSERQRKGWGAGTVRAILHNEAYTGAWTFNRKQWVKSPDSASRVPRAHPEEEVLRMARPHLRIISQELWEQVQARLAAVRLHYTGSSDAKTQRPSVAGGAAKYLMSGLLFCDACSAPMVIAGGSSQRYYRCIDSLKRGTCANKLSIRESLARERILSALRQQLASPQVIAYVHSKIGEKLDQMHHGANAQLQERRQRAAQLEKRIQGLVAFISDGDRSEAVTKALREFEAQSRDERSAIAVLEGQVRSPPRMAPTEEVLRRVFDLDARLNEDIIRGREELRRFFSGGQIRLRPENGRYVARARVLPPVLMDSKGNTPPPSFNSGEACNSAHCGGAIRREYTESVSRPVAIRLAL